MGLGGEGRRHQPGLTADYFRRLLFVFFRFAEDFRAFATEDFRAFLTFFFARFTGRRRRLRESVCTTSSGATAKAGRIAAKSSSASSMSSVTKSGPAVFFLFAISFAPQAASRQDQHSRKSAAAVKAAGINPRDAVRKATRPGMTGACCCYRQVAVLCRLFHGRPVNEGHQLPARTKVFDVNAALAIAREADRPAPIVGRG
jgi:hypothetical protein